MRYLMLLLLAISSLSSSAREINVDSITKEAIKLFNNGDYNKSIDLLNTALPVAITSNDKKLQLIIYNNLGNNYSNTGKTIEALNAYQKAISIAEETGNKRGACSAIKNIGALYSDLKEFDKALVKFNEAEAIGISINDTATIADCANNRGLIYEQQKKYPEALAEYKKALTLYQATNAEERMAILFNNLGIVFKYLKDYDQSISCYQKSLAISEKLENKFMVAANLANIGNVYEMKGDYKMAIELNEKALKTGVEINSSELIIETYGNLAEEYSKLGNYQMGYDLYKKYTSAKDSIMNIEKSRQMAEIQTKYDTEKKEKQIAEMEKTHYKMLAVIGILSLTMIIAFLLFSRLQTIQKQKREKSIAEAEYNERLRIAKDVHDDLGAGLSKISLMADLAQRKISGNEQLSLELASISAISNQLINKKHEIKPNGTIPDLHVELPVTQELMDINTGLEGISKFVASATNHARGNIILGNEIKQISAMSRELVDNMRDLIWVLNPENTTLDQLVTRLREYCGDYLDGMQIDPILDFQLIVPELKITREAQRNIFLTVKETVNNSIKHSGTAEMTIKLSVVANWLKISIADKGKGFDMQLINKNGNGLRNMKQRIESIGGQFIMNSVIGQGTETTISISLNKLANPKNTTKV